MLGELNNNWSVTVFVSYKSIQFNLGSLNKPVAAYLGLQLLQLTPHNIHLLVFVYVVARNCLRLFVCVSAHPLQFLLAAVPLDYYVSCGVFVSSMNQNLNQDHCVGAKAVDHSINATSFNSFLTMDTTLNAYP